MGSLVDYDEHYAKGPDQCGPAFDEVTQFVAARFRPRARLLDLGCGQGRDSILAARLGYSVVGVDLSRLGLEQLAQTAESEGLSIALHHADATSFRSRSRFDVVLLDRVLHLLLSDDERVEALQNAERHARVHGAIAVVDGPKHSSLVQAYFDARPAWTIEKRTKRFLFATR